MRTALRLILIMALIPITGQHSFAQEDGGVQPSLADVKGVEITMLAWRQVNLYPAIDSERQAQSEMDFGRSQLPPGASELVSIREGDKAIPAAGVAFVEYGTVTVQDSLGMEHSVAAPGVIRDATELRNQSFDCVWVLRANHYHVPPMGGGGFTDAQSLLLPSSVPCDQPDTQLGNLKLPGDVPPGPGTMFIAEIEIEPGFNLAGHTENGFIGIAVERGDLAIQPDVSYETESTVYLKEGSEYAIQADTEHGATGLMYGFLRSDSDAVTATPQALNDRISQMGFAFSKQRYTKNH